MAGENGKHRVAIGHPLAMNAFGHWVRLLRSGGGVDPKYYGRALFVTALSPITPLSRLIERVRHGGRVAAAELKDDPVFIIGHWRSGTTHLHNLLSRDPRFGFVTTFQTQAPKSFLSAYHTSRVIMSAMMPGTRPMDNMPLGTDLPQEEEFCLCNACMHSFYVCWYFPRIGEERLFRKYVLFDGVSEAEFEEWRREYVELVKKATINMDGRQLVLKNPANTARVESILRVFPQARFIHIYRDPYVVYKSTLQLRRTLPRMFTFQNLEFDDLEERVLQEYREMMGRFFERKGRIPKGQLAEIRYEDL
ncbi:MAG: hypothetical protein GWP08_19290, partial [Nitrospiraceae bacterium]|nr:hypothetical protein [Nitrospiraceae bacterium]